MFGRSLTSIEDLSNDEIEDIIELAGEMWRDMRANSSLADGQIMAALFYEPSTRTRGSFESAINRLGGRAITAAGAASSSLVKGESLVDTIRVWSQYADIIVLRHKWEGAARLAAEYASVPVINGGDGGHEHPTQTLCDLFTLAEEKGSLRGLRVALCGDLKNGRTVHSLVFGLLRFGAELFFVPGEGLGLPPHVESRIREEYGREVERVPAGEFGALFGKRGGEASMDAVYVTPSGPHQRALLEEERNVRFGASPGSDVVLYVTRQQTERQDADVAGRNDGGGRYPHISKATLGRRFARSIVMHPLPRVGEIAPDMDEDHRSRYFAQAAFGVPVRMALISLMLGLRPWRRAATSQSAEREPVSAVGLECQNVDCVTQRERQSCDASFYVIGRNAAPVFSCVYCSWENRPRAYGLKQSGRYIYKRIESLRVISQHQLRQFRFFDTDEQARGEGYELSQRCRGQTGALQGSAE